MGDQILAGLATEEWTGAFDETNPLQRDVSEITNYATGTITRTGPDGVVTTTNLDDAGRVDTVQMGAAFVDYDYDNAGRLNKAIYNNNTRTIYLYDAADRLTQILHRISAGSTLLQLDYEYLDDPDNPNTPPIPLLPDGRPLIWRITETNGLGEQATVTFAYDNRGRLLSEERTVPALPPDESSDPDDDTFDFIPMDPPAPTDPTDPPPDDPPPATEPSLLYSIAYAYDQLGNRLSKTESVADRTTFYHYDVQPEHDTDFDSHNNRLQWYRIYDGTLTTEPDPTTASESVMYKYDAGGHPSTIVKKISGDSTYRALRMTYDTSGRLWLAESYEWQVNQGSGNFTNVTRTAVREFRYDGGGRARYLMQDRDPVTLDVEPGSTQWSHYQGNSIYGDYTVNATNTGFDDARRYLPGVAQLDPDPADPAILNPEFVHGDQVRSTRALTDDTGAFTREAIYSAFGEPILTEGTSDTRYGFVGDLGYEGALIPGWQFVHIGARWYDPSSGRFLQRDTMGIDGGLNVYAYVENSPVLSIDPDGRTMIDLGGGYEGRWDRVPRPGGKVGGHLHVYKKGQEVAKICENGRWNKRHGGKTLNKPSEVPKPVRASIRSFLRGVVRGATNTVRSFMIVVGAEYSVENPNTDWRQGFTRWD